MKQSKIKPYLLYALGELLLIVLGIVIAVQISNWNTKREARQIEQKYFNKLSAELKADLERYEFRDSMYQIISDNCDKILDIIAKDSPPIDKRYLFEIDFLSFFPLSPNFSTYEEMLNTGRLYAIENKELRTSIVDYYNAIKKGELAIESSNERIKQYMDQVILNDFWLIRRRIETETKEQIYQEFSWVSEFNSDQMKAIEVLVIIASSTNRKNQFRVNMLLEQGASLYEELQHL